MRKRLKINVISILVVIIVILLAGYLDYMHEVRFNSFVTEYGDNIISKYEEEIVDEKFLSLFDSFSTNRFVTIEPNYVQSLLNVTTVNLLLIGILCFWLIAFINIFGSCLVATSLNTMFTFVRTRVML